MRFRTADAAQAAAAELAASGQANWRCLSDEEAEAYRKEVSGSVGQWVSGSVGQWVSGSVSK